MERKLLIVFLILGLYSSERLHAQSIKTPYFITSGELIFSQNNTSFTPEFLQQYPGAVMSESRTRFTCFFHLGQYLHYDFSDNFGLFTGLAIRNVGMITDETLPQTVTLTGADVAYSNYKIIRRQYTLGLPLAIKLGSFGKHFYFFGGAEYEMAFHFKEKFWTDTWDRSGSKTKSTQWFADQTPLFLPSAFAGVQFPGGFNLRFKYYLTDFLDNNYKVSKNSQDGSTYSISDLSRYQESQVFYLSLCWQFNSSFFTKGFGKK
ncbi:MAG: hypothetical protein U0W24_10400 [Bacteroidales bacterium]